MIGSILTSVLILGGVGLTFGALIAVSHRRFKVYDDPRLDVLVDMLPGTNCGACGCAGCRVFAETLVAGGIQPAGCTVMGADDISAVADFLGVEAGEGNARVARLLCAGGCDVAPRTAEYRGLRTCTAAAAVAGGGKSCTWGCLGLGDCEDVCDFDAIYMNNVELPVVIPDKCTACGDCVDVCPKNLFELMPVDRHLIVQCKNLLAGDAAESTCSVVCNACGRCVVDAAHGLIEIVNGLAVIDYDKNEIATSSAIKRCPTGAIVWLEGQQFRNPERKLEVVA